MVGRRRRKRAKSSQAPVEELVGSLEAACLRALWARSPATVADVLATVNERHDPPLAYTTVMTVLSRLHEKGWVSRERDGRAYRYAPAYSEAELAATLSRRDVDRLVERYGEVALAQFAEALRRVDPDLLARTERLAEGGRDG